VIEAANADEALTLLEAAGGNVRVLVTDVEMPGSMDGFTLTRVVHKAWPHIGLVVVSGRMKPQADEVPKGTVFLSKPFRAKALIKAVHSVLGPEPVAATEPALPIIPAALKIDLPYTGIVPVVAPPAPLRPVRPLTPAIKPYLTEIRHTFQQLCERRFRQL
jgi:CheY-like chemotaxis protein